MRITCKAVEKYLSTSQIILESLKDDSEVQGKVAFYGYTNERLQQILDIRNAADKTYQDSVTKRKEQQKLNEEVNEKFESTGKKFSYLVEIFKTYFQDDREFIKELGLNTWRSRSIPSFIAQATNVYTNAMRKPHILEKLEVFNYTAERLQEELNELVVLQELYKRYRLTIGESQQLTAERDIKMGELKREMNPLKAFLFMIYENENVQTLERVGVFVRNPVSRSTEEEEEEQDPGQAGTNPPAETPEVPEIPPAAG
jgi:hypothetical protein